MSIEDLKLRVIDLILKTDDHQLLRQLLVLIEEDYYAEGSPVGLLREPMTHYGKASTLEVCHLAEEEKAAIQESREQFARGEVLTSEEAEEEIRAWLKD